MNENNELNNQNVQTESTPLSPVTPEVAPAPVESPVSAPVEEVKTETKSNKGVVIVLIIIIVALACGLGYMVYLSNNTKCDAPSTDVTTTTVSTSSASVADLIKTYAGSWSYQKYYTDYPECYYFDTLTLKEDGTYEFNTGESCGDSQIASGNYYFSNDKIYLVNDKCTFEEGSDENPYCGFGNCSTEFILDYSNGTITYEGNALTLEK